MKPGKPIPRQSAKIKRGTEFIIIETGEVVKFHIIDPQGLYLVKRANGSFDPFTSDELKESVKGRGTIKQVAKPVSSEERERRETLDEFFDRMALKIPFHCQNCGKPLYAYSKKAKRSVCAHILQKAIFKSVATNEDNILFMGADYIGCPCSCHDRYDMNAEIRSSMKIYPLVLERFEKLKPFLTDKELVQAFTYLNIKWQ